MVTVRVCSKLKTSWKSVVFTNKVGRILDILWEFLNKTIIPLALVGYETTSKIQLVVYYQCWVVIGWATTRLYVIAH